MKLDLFISLKMTDAQWEMTELAIVLSYFGVNIVFEGGSVDAYSVR